MSEKPDVLSRRNNHAIMPKPELVIISAERFKGFAVDISNGLPAMILEAQKEDLSLTTLQSTVANKEDFPATVKKKFREHHLAEDLLWYQARIMVPDDKDPHLTLLQLIMTPLLVDIKDKPAPLGLSPDMTTGQE